jgi:hypothetical protein
MDLGPSSIWRKNYIMKVKLSALLIAFAMVIGTSVGSAVAQEATPSAEESGMSSDQIDASFSDQILSDLGLPVIEIVATGTGFEVPIEMQSGPHLVILHSTPETFSYAVFAQPPAGLTEEEATLQLLETGRDDIPHEGWVYAGGSFAVEGASVSFVVDLAPGEWVAGVSYQAGETGEEIMTLYPVTVTEASADAPQLTVDVSVQLNDTEFLGLEGPVGTGPKLFEFTNVGEHPRQMVLMRSPIELTSEDFVAIFEDLMADEESEIFNQLIWVGYHSVLSSGQTVWLELDLEPGIYTATSWVIDLETEMPALLLGMVQSFTVE